MTKRETYKWVYIGNGLLGFLQVFWVLNSVIDKGIWMLQFYTELSNLFSGFVAIAMAYYAYRYYKNGKEIPEGIRNLRYITVCLTTITFLIAFLVLGRTFGYKWMLFRGEFLFTHTICPFLSFLLFVFLEKEPPLKKEAIILTLLPTALYGMVVIPLNILRIMKGPYPFLMVYEQPWYSTFFWLIGIGLLSYAVARVIYDLNQTNWNE